MQVAACKARCGQEDQRTRDTCVCQRPADSASSHAGFLLPAAVLAAHSSAAATTGSLQPPGGLVEVASSSGRIPVFMAATREDAQPVGLSPRDRASRSHEFTAPALLAANAKSSSLPASSTSLPRPRTAPPAAAAPAGSGPAAAQVPVGYRVFQPRPQTACDPKRYLGMPLSVLRQIPAVTVCVLLAARVRGSCGSGSAGSSLALIAPARANTRNSRYSPALAPLLPCSLPPADLSPQTGQAGQTSNDMAGRQSFTVRRG